MFANCHIPEYCLTKMKSNSLLMNNNALYSLSPLGGLKIHPVLFQTKLNNIKMACYSLPM